MLNKKVAKAINEQINKELYSAYLYLAMANYFEQQGLSGFAHYFTVQAREEEDHAWGFRKYLIHRGAQVDLFAIEKPVIDFKNIRDPFVLTVEHEQFVSRSIEDILELAHKEKDHMSAEFLQWYIKEQAEEENNAETNLMTIDFIAGDKGVLFTFNLGLGKREYHPTGPNLD